MINALILDKKDDEKITAEIADISLSDLPEGDVLVDIHYSTLNYKDSLAITSSSPEVASATTSAQRLGRRGRRASSWGCRGITSSEGGGA